MNKMILSFAAVVCAATFAMPASAQTRFAAQGFNAAGDFQMTLSGPGDIEASTNLQTWTRFASVSQETTLDDVASRKAEWRFYRLRGGSAPGNAIGFVKATIQPGRLALLGSAFATPLRLDTPEGRAQVFGIPNPQIELALYANGNFTPHTLNTATGAWSPALRPLRDQEGFSVKNLGATPLAVRMSGELRQGQINLSLPAGPSLVVPPVPQPGPVIMVLGIPSQDGMQILFFNEETQAYVVSSYDPFDAAWQPKLPDYRPGRSFVVRSPAAVNWTKTFSAAPR
jgi:hypothetical protein